MGRLLSLIALFGVMAFASVASIPSAHAAALSSGIHALKTEQTSVAEKTATRCWWRNGRRHCRWVGPRGNRCWWRNGRRICRW
jgi:hypothetical protein